MNKDIIEGNWSQIKGQIREQWGKLTDDDVDVAEGNADYLAGKIQERYGLARDKVKEQIRAFERSI